MLEMPTKTAAASGGSQTARRTQQERSDTTTAELLEAARGLFAADGYEATSLDGIVEAAGVIHHVDGLGLGYDALSATDPRLISCSITGFGRTGPDRDRAGLDLILQAESGLMSVTGEPGRPPAKVGVPVTDLASALYGAFSIVTALLARQATGRGQLIDLSLIESGVSLAIWESGVYLTTGEVPGPLGSAHRVTAPYQAFRTADGYVAIGATTPPTWTAFCRVTGLERLEADPAWRDGTTRHERAGELASIIESVTVTRTTGE